MGHPQALCGVIYLHTVAHEPFLKKAKMRMQLKVDFFFLFILTGSFNNPGWRGWDAGSWMCHWRGHGMGTKLTRAAKISFELSGIVL